jgi:hypothetical protein
MYISISSNGVIKKFAELGNIIGCADDFKNLSLAIIYVSNILSLYK